MRRVVLVLATSAALMALSALPATAVEPGAGAVVFNLDGSPIGSELTYGAGNAPQFVYTAETGDDDSWALDAEGEPANQGGAFDPAVSGIPLGFSVNVAGVVYDQAIVNSNGGVCLYSSTDPAAQEADGNCGSMYYEPVSVYGDPSYVGGPDNMAAFLPFANDLYAPYVEPVDTDASGTADACTFGAYFAEFEGNPYCSSVFWGATTYEGKAAFAATWFHDPDIDAGDGEEDRYSTVQVIIVDDGSGDVTLVYNYDEVDNEGSSLSGYEPTDTNPAAAACGVAYDGGDTAEYLHGGVVGTNFAANTFVSTTFWGPECSNPLYAGDALALVDGGATPIVAGSLNSTIPGRYVFRLVNGAVDLTLAAAAPGPQLAATGVSAAAVPLGAAGLVVLAGVALLVWRRRATLEA